MAGSPKKKARRERWEAMKADENLKYDVLEWIAEGRALTAFAQSKDIPTTTIFDYVNRECSNSDEYSRMYARARECRANTFVDKMVKDADDCRKGLLDPKAAKVCIETNQWLAARTDPHIWGDTKHVKIDATVSLKESLDLAMDRLNKVRANIKSEYTVIDAEEVSGID